VVKTPFTGRVHLAKKRKDYYPPDGTSKELFTTNELDRDDLRLDFPAAVGVGASWRIASALTVSADYTHTSWSHAYIHNFYVLSVTPLPPPGTPQQPPAPQVFDSLKYPLLDPSQNDAQQIRVGAEYVFIHKRLKFPLRAGYIFDQQYFQAQGGHAPVFGALTLGTGILAGPLLLDFAYVRELGSFTDTDGAATRQMTYRVVASAIYRLGSVH
jgi:long-subunit fatty acid transport protein